ncbi:unnamed protein product [Caenorhabditis angaria]|uniref:Serpentine Receptor, class H n=1 Tax=Caenorhabditis angaria TaxID=860376 RepID=A0A9P1IYG8_9PELO|nr:unnamed protein product [Caenorhabditis angaria]
MNIYRFSSIFSNIIYFSAIFALRYKCPESFRKYQTLLCVHTVANLILENYLTTLWKIMITTPWMSVCGFGLIYDYPAVNIGVFVILLQITASTIVVLLEYRMKAVVSLNHRNIAKLASVLKHFYTLTQVVVFFSFLYAYDDFRYQNDYKLEVDEVDGPLPEFVFCDNCIIFNLHSWKTIAFALAATFSTTIAANSGLLMAFASYHALAQTSTMFSKRTMLVQRSFLRSLFIQLAVHFLFLVAPIFIFFAAFLLKLSMEKWQIFVHSLTVLFAQHGSFSTLAMLGSNKQLRRNLNLFTQKVRRGLQLSSNIESDRNLNQTSFAFQQYNQNATRLATKIN